MQLRLVQLRLKWTWSWGAFSPLLLNTKIGFGGHSLPTSKNRSGFRGHPLPIPEPARRGGMDATQIGAAQTGSAQTKSGLEVGGLSLPFS